MYNENNFTWGFTCKLFNVKKVMIVVIMMMIIIKKVMMR
jgi:hypothetical protein